MLKPVTKDSLRQDSLSAANDFVQLCPNPDPGVSVIISQPASAQPSRIRDYPGGPSRNTDQQ
jgi:hypothetical protein